MKKSSDSVNFEAKDLKRRQNAENMPHYLLAFLLPMFTVITAFAILQCYPFGKRTMLTVDLYHQYAPYLVAFRDKILSGDSLLYSWNDGLGNEYFGAFANYTASPLNIFCIFFTAKTMPVFIALITAVRAGSDPQIPSAVTPLSAQKTAIARRPARRSAVPRMPAIRMTSRSSSPRLPTGFASASHRPFAAVSASLSISGIPPKFIGQLHGLLYVMSCLFVTAHSVQSISNSIMPERIPGNKMQFPSA